MSSPVAHLSSLRGGLNATSLDQSYSCSPITEAPAQRHALDEQLATLSACLVSRIPRLTAEQKEELGRLLSAAA